jgi:hypothetical protein
MEHGYVYYTVYIYYVYSHSIYLHTMILVCVCVPQVGVCPGGAMVVVQWGYHCK